MLGKKKYPINVFITKKWEHGIYRGYTSTEKMGFITERDARAWAESVSQSSKVDYSVTKMVDCENNRIIFYNDSVQTAEAN